MNMNTKRRREEEEGEFGDDFSFKRFRSVDQSSFSNKPFLPSHTPSPSTIVTDLQAITPAPSECANSPERFLDGPTRQYSQTDTDMDMDMDDDEADTRSQPTEDSPFGGNSFMRPPMLNTSLSAPSMHNTSRIPTPIYPNFHRAGMNGLGFPNNNNNSPPSTHPPPHAQPAWQAARHDLDDDRTRRMPSPISEDEDLAGSPIELTQSQLSRLSVSFDDMDTATDAVETCSPPAAAAPPTPRSGRKRSGALTGSGRLVMGYREDCEKCRLRVPGHYSHFLPA
ncbi:hypothetical protein P153DRAFT_373190 [Dothidotthia symphoricarpi CBS 119687]|uniref:Uncharacterized protein n=1 Tax=Dothidotthia symphoricarpi CBS 119687 TaxID=1392245 RepID=A0A6A6AR03_9PLEO|nr:uncharacterized protein P153DRAFT_373190 [Dothidotthia symphoricarpi CBS 119687]KAF2133608.1 hypothetical protein P153DRAFT_373190 [Dothidotthia symphoricarpi CBS 119687]